MEPLHIPATRIRQQGASLMVMLVILIIGFTTFLVGAFSINDLKNLRTSNNSDVLAQAKDALIGRAASDTNVPGSLPCPDTNDDGISEGGSTCSNGFIGRLPWKTLGLPDLRDAAGERLWYVLSNKFSNNSSLTINSDTLGTITVFSPGGTQLHNGAGTNGAVALIIAPGSPLTRQDGTQQNRSGAGTTVASNYLDNSTTNIDNAVFTGSSTATTGFIQGEVKDASGKLIVNDQLLVVTREQLFPPVEMRIAREAKNCLDDYATSNGSKYPWPTDPTDVSFYFSKSGILFGRIPKHEAPDSNVQDLINKLSAFQTAVTNCAAGTGSQTTLGSTGSALENIADYVKDHQPTSPAIPTTVTNPLKSAGDKAKDGVVTCADIQSNPTGNSIQTNLDSAMSALNGLAPTMSWPASCTLFGTTYWPKWRDQVFYQIDPQYKPGGSLGTPSLTINGTGAGSYRAALLVARSPINGGPNRITTDPSTYLEGANQHTNPTPSSAFVGYSINSQNYKAINDLVLCIDGKVACK